MNMYKIPRIIHQTWKTTNVPSLYTPWVKSWKENHPGWQYMLWTDDMNIAFIKKYAPDFLRTYRNYPHTIQRVDAVRYFILYHLGGMFIDLDFECLENIELLLKNQECVFGTEPPAHCEQHNKELIVCNALMACAPGNNFFKIICESLQKYLRVKTTSVPAWLEILDTTGPFKLTELYNAYTEKGNIKLISSDLLYPFSIKETRELINSAAINEVIQKKIDGAYAVHYFLGSWW
ncbi:MAG TPA: glycoside transferase family 32 [Sphingobacteriaceae bacterium]|nr:glycoside transferase family 32 [Sphingobacteriaceae bacterium]